jgi:hypothetical protein
VVDVIVNHRTSARRRRANRLSAPQELWRDAAADVGNCDSVKTVGGGDRGMMIGMTAKAKIAVTVDPARVEAARRAVSEGRVGSVSAYVERAMERYEQVDPFLADLDETLMKTGGPLTDEERAAIDREMGW